MASPVVQKIQFKLDDDNLKQAGRGLRGVDAETKKAQKGVTGLRDRFRQMGAVGKIAIGVLVAGMVQLARAGFRVLNESVRLAGIQQIADRKLDQAIRNTGAATDEWLPKLKAAASELQQVSNFGDEVTQTSQALLLSFKAASGPEGAVRLTRVMGDMTAALQRAGGEGADMTAVARALGQSLEGNVGILTRYGVKLTDAEVAQLKASQGMERVEYLAGLLEERFEGLAESSVDPFVQIGNAVGDLKEDLGIGLREALAVFAKDFIGLASDEDVKAFVRDLGERLGNHLERIFNLVRDNGPQLTALFEDVAGAGEGVFQTASAIGEISQAIDDIKESLGPMRELLEILENISLVNILNPLTQIQAIGEFLGFIKGESASGSGGGGKLTELAPGRFGRGIQRPASDDSGNSPPPPKPPPKPPIDPDDLKKQQQELARINAEVQSLIEKFERAKELMQADPAIRAQVAEIFGLIEEVRNLDEQIAKTTDTDLKAKLQAIRDEKEARKEALTEALQSSEKLRKFAEAVGPVKLPIALPETADLVKQMRESRITEQVSEIVKSANEEIAAIQLRAEFDPNATPEQVRAEVEAVAEKAKASLQAIFEEFGDIFPPELRKEILDWLKSVEKQAKKTDKSLEKAGDALRNMADAGRGLTDLLHTLGLIDDQIAGIIDGVTGAVRGLGELRSVQAAGGGALAQAVPGIGIGVSILSAAHSFANSIVAKERAERERAEQQRRAMAELTRALNESKRAFQKFADDTLSQAVIGGNLSQDQIETARAIFPISSSEIQTDEQVRAIIADLFDAGLIDQSFVDIYESWLERTNPTTAFGQALRQSGFGAFADELIANFGQFSNTVEGAFASLDRFRLLLGDGEDALDHFARFLLDNVADLPPQVQALLEEALKLDLSKEEDRERLQEIIRTVFAAIEAGGFDFGGLSPDDVERILETAFGFASPAGSPGDEDEPSNTFQVQRVLTSVQANAVILALDALVFYAQRADKHLEMIAGAIVPAALSGAMERTLASRTPRQVTGDLASARQVTVSVGDVTVSRPYTSGEDDLRATMEAMEAAIRRKGYKAFRG